MTAALSMGDDVVDYADVFEQIGYHPHPGQRRIHASVARNRVVSAGRRFGKSRVGGMELYPECVLTYTQKNILLDTDQRREFWIVGPEYSDSEKEFRVLWDVLKRQDVPMDRPGSYNDPIGGSLHISCFNGRFQVHAKSAKHPETLVGEGLSGVIMAEAAKLKESTWTRYIRPTLADYKGWALFSSTPEGKNWFYRLWRLGRDPEFKEWNSWRMPSWLNPYVYRTETNEVDLERAMKLINHHRKASIPGLSGMLDRLNVDPEILSLAMDLTPQSFNQEIGAKFTDFVGRVFKDFDEEVHVGDFKFDPRWETYAAVDYGFTNPFVWLLVQIGPWGEIRIVGEYYRRGMTIPEIANELIQRNLVPNGLICFYPDPASPGDSRDLSDRLRIKYRGGTGGPLKTRLDAIRGALRDKSNNGTDQPRLMIDRSCVETIREFNDYRYPKSYEESVISSDNAPEAPLKKDDHTPEALGRFFAGHLEADLKNSHRTKVRSSRMR